MQNTEPSAPAAADPGFKLPGAPSATPDSAPKTAAGQSAQMEVKPQAGAPASDTSSRDAAIGGVVFTILLVLYFFARNAYVHHLVVRRVAPSAAGSAGWMMFVGLLFLSAAVVLAIINASKFLTIAVAGPLVVLGLIALVAALFVGRR
jgi:hypothetical protein